VKKLLLLSLCASTMLFAGGSKIPYVSLDSVAKSGANIAYTPDADAVYFNPPNISWLDNKRVIELGINAIHASKITWTGSTQLSAGATISETAQEENKIAPNTFYVSPKMGKFRYGVSLTSPYGLTRRWLDTHGASYTNKASLVTIDLNPVVSYQINSSLSIAAGIRLVHGELELLTNIPATASLDITADDISYGYNLALGYRPTDEIKFGLTYRSQVDLNVKSTKSNISVAALGGLQSTTASAKVILPASLSMGLAYTLPSKTTIELTFERSYWGSIKESNLNFSNSIVEAALGTPAPVSWNDTDMFAIGLTQEYDKYTAMLGFAIEESTIDQSSQNFVDPDANSKIYSIGGRYQYSEKINLGLAYIYKKLDTSVVNNTAQSLNGSFNSMSASIVSGTISYTF